MESSRRQSNPCSSCATMTGVFVCQGCKENFCLDHTCEHRHMLQRSMNEITIDCDELLKSVKKIRNERRRLLMEQIEQWEKQAVEKIHRLADETRDHASTMIQQDSEDIIEKIELLARKLEDAYRDDGYFETDLKRWSQKLDELRNLVKPTRSMQMKEENQLNSFIPRIYLEDAPYQSDDSLIYEALRRNESSNQDNASNDVDPPKKKKLIEYSEGRVPLRFTIDQLEKNNEIRLGIVSTQKSIGALVSEDLTFYGWTNNNDNVYLGGDSESGYNGYKSDFQAGDIYELVLDCDNRTIQLKNERTKAVHTLNIALNKCPFPWKPFAQIFSKPI